MGKLTVYKASAGSGKTFRLAMEYVKLLINNPLNYRHILAVTFTNDATKEMKERILLNLRSISRGQVDNFMLTVMAETHKSSDEVKRAATLALSNILHDYSMFSISTIDSFVQRIVQSILWEMGFHSSTEIKLDTDTYIEHAVDQILDSSATDEKMFNRIKEMMLGRLNDDKSHDIRTSLVKLGQLIYSEHFRMLSAKQKELMNDIALLDNVEQFVNRQLDDFAKNLNALGNKALVTISDAGFTADDFSYRKAGVYGFFLRASQFPKSEPKTWELVKPRVIKALNEVPQGWVAKSKTGSKSNDSALETLIINSLHPQLQQLVNFIESRSEEYNTAYSISKNINTLWVINSIRSTISRLLSDEGAMLLVDSGPLLREFVTDNDAPFVYEKIGTRYQNYMLDEFQDTSQIQWSNFKPLILNSIATGCDNLLVGDVKQAIYRWRNSDWGILARGFDAPFHPDYRSLDTNFRSLPQIVNFNNLLFEGVANNLKHWALDLCDQALPESLHQLVEKVYQNPAQKILNPEQQPAGYVEIACAKFTEKRTKDKLSEVVVAWMQKLIPQLFSRGYKPGDIAVLVRDKTEGNLIASTLLEMQVSVMSQGALRLTASHAVRLCVAALKLVHNPGDKLAKGLLAKERYMFADNQSDWAQAFMYQQFTTEINFLNNLRFKPLASIFEAILNYYDLTTKTDELPYIAMLHEKILELTKSGATSLNRFVEWWDQTGFKITLNMPQSDLSVNILTIHKSKGLQFPVVIVPFSGIEIFNQNKRSFVWTEIDGPQYSTIPLYPVLSDMYLKHSTLSTVYKEESVQTLVDALNLLYVAYTRPKNELYAMFSYRQGKESGKKREYAYQQLDEIVLPIINSMPAASVGSEMYGDVMVDVHRFGVAECHHGGAVETHSDNAYELDTYCVGHELPRIAIQRDSSEFFRSEPAGNLGRAARGQLLHRLFSLINTLSDVPAAVEQLCFEGLLQAETAAKLEAHIKSLLSQSPYNQWFDGSWQVNAERSIINTDGQTYRPDRVMIRSAHALVLDYKFGARAAEHTKQVANYMQLLGAMGYTPVEGFVWYVASNKLQRVDANL